MQMVHCTKARVFKGVAPCEMPRAASLVPASAVTFARSWSSVQGTRKDARAKCATADHELVRLARDSALRNVQRQLQLGC
eukprot:scaffold41331_cov65-Phaeocystis_antarctica.AAC.2